MRLLEWVTIFSLFVGWAALLIPAKKTKPVFSGWQILPAFLPLLVAALQLWIEQYRWSMVPAYLLAGLFFLIGVSRIGTNQPKHPAGLGGRILNGTGGILGLATVALAAALPGSFPIFPLAEPAGPYAVGTTVFEWVDESRPESFSPDPGDRRDLLVQVWYPAEKVPGAHPLPMWPDAKILGPQIAGSFGMPGFLFDHMDLVPSHAYPDAPPASAGRAFPVLVFSHSYTPGFIGQNIVQMEELASHGYTVFSIGHPYETAAITYPDGRMIPYSSERYDAVIRNGTVKAIPILKEFVAASDPAEQERLFRQYLDANPAVQESVDVWTEDTLFVLDQIERVDRGGIDSPLAGSLDLERVGIFGHSMGGVVAGETCMVDPRCKAAVNLDGVQFGGLIDGNLEQPLLMMYSEINAGQNDLLFDRMENPYYRIVVAGTVHTDYCDFPLISPLFAAAGAAGSVNPYRMEKIINSYLLAFFDRYLRGVDSPLLYGPDPDFPEVDFRSRNTE